MRITIDKNQYLVCFYHTSTQRQRNHVEALDTLTELKQKKRKARTTCVIKRVIKHGTGKNDGQYATVVQDFADCSRKDNFNKAVGREISFTRAMVSMIENPKQRYLAGRILVALSAEGQHLISLGKFPQ